MRGEPVGGDQRIVGDGHGCSLRLLRSSLPDLIRQSILLERIFLRGWTRGSSPRVTTTSPLLLRFPLLDRPAGVAPGGKTAAHMRDRLQAHVLGGLGRERRAHAAGAVEDELLVL